MKRFPLHMLLLAAGALVLVTACPKKETTTQVPEKEIRDPFTSEAYHSDPEFFRATGAGISPNFSVARKIAETNARRALADEVLITLKKVTDSCIKEEKMDEASEAGTGVDDATRPVVNQALEEAVIFDRKTQQRQGKYTHYLAIRMPVEPVIRDMQEHISKDSMLHRNCDAVRFKAIFNAKMQKPDERKGN